MTTKLSTHDNLEHLDATIKSDQWKNLCFWKDGTSGVCEYTYASEADAYAAYDKHEAWCLAVDEREGHKNWKYHNSDRKRSEYSHTIQIPWKQGN